MLNKILSDKRVLTDETNFNIGQYGDCKMINIPASYLCKLWKKVYNKPCPLHYYIADALPILRLEHKHIWAEPDLSDYNLDIFSNWKPDLSDYIFEPDVDKFEP